MTNRDLTDHSMLHIFLSYISVFCNLCKQFQLFKFHRHSKGHKPTFLLSLCDASVAPPFIISDMSRHMSRTISKINITIKMSGILHSTCSCSILDHQFANYHLVIAFY